jgi:hypothetical protein
MRTTGSLDTHIRVAVAILTIGEWSDTNAPTVKAHLCGREHAIQWVSQQLGGR